MEQKVKVKVQYVKVLRNWSIDIPTWTPVNSLPYRLEVRMHDFSLGASCRSEQDTVCGTVSLKLMFYWRGYSDNLNR